MIDKTLDRKEKLRNFDIKKTRKNVHEINISILMESLWLFFDLFSVDYLYFGFPFKLECLLQMNLN